MPMFTFSHTHVALDEHEPLTGWQFEYLPWPALVEIALNATGASVVATVSSGSDMLGEEQPVQSGGTIGVMPDYDKPQFEDLAAAGDRLKIKLREIVSATPTSNGWVRLTRLG